MLISQKNRIGFIHIPKCGGSTIKHQFAAMADTEINFTGRAEHPVLGPVFMGHLPLWAIRAEFPETFAQLEAFRLFAICRDPYDRFESAVSQRLNFLHQKRINAFPYRDILDFVAGISDELRAADRLVSAEFCHFIPQSDFVFLEDVQVVDTLYTLASIDDLAAEISRLSGIPATAGFKSNQTLEFRVKGSESAFRQVSGLSRKLLPGRVHATAKAMAKKLLTRGGSRYKGFARREPAISDFVQDYYARDLALFETVSAGSAA